MNNRIKILQCIRQGMVGGGETHLLSLMENIDKNIFEPVVLSFTEGPMVDALRKLGIQTNVIYTEKPFDVSIWGKIAAFVKSQQVSLIHAHGTRAASNLLWAAKRQHIPLVYTVHGWSFHPEQKPWVYKMRAMGEKLITRQSALNISVSKSNQETGQKELGKFESVVVNNGIDHLKYNPATVTSSIRTELGISANKILILFVARFTEHKQPLLLIKAFKKALQSNAELHLLMVGEGDQKNEGVALAETLGLQHAITFQPFRPDVPAVLASGDIYVLPSIWEGLPIGLLEAMAMEKAVIGTNVDGTREVIQHMQNGWLTQGQDVEEAVAEAILTLASDSNLRSTLGTQARKDMLHDFSAAEMTHQIESLYQSILHRN
jgi:glycosyltransferase involved in cell wall biosynthesis